MVQNLTSVPQVIGSPANPVARLSAWNIYQGRQVLPVNGTRWIPAPLWSVIHDEVMKQCDGIDGVSLNSFEHIAQLIAKTCSLLTASSTIRDNASRYPAQHHTRKEQS